MKTTKPQPVNILHIVSGDLWAGAEVQFFTLAKTLGKHSEAILNVILLNHGTLEQKLIEHGINVIVIDENNFNSIRVLLKLISTIKKIQPDIIHTHRVKENILGSISALVNGNIPSLRTAHGAAEHKPAWYQIPKRLILYLDLLCGRFLQKKIVAVSEDLAKILASTYPQKKIVVIENGIDIDALSQIKKHEENLSPTMRICLAGRLAPIKRVDIFIQTAQHVKKVQPDLPVSFHIYGDGPLLEELKTLSRQSQTEDIVHFEGHSDDILSELQKMNALLMTSDHEGLPMILLEAMTLQIPIITHAVGGIPQLLDHGTCGFLVDEHSAAGYTDKILQLHNAPEETTEKTRLAFARVNNFYSAKENAKKYSREYQQLVKNKS